MTASTPAVNGTDERRHVPDGGGGSAWGAQNNTGGGEKVLREGGEGEAGGTGECNYSLYRRLGWTVRDRQHDVSRNECPDEFKKKLTQGLSPLRPKL